VGDRWRLATSTVLLLPPRAAPATTSAALRRPRRAPARRWRAGPAGARSKDHSSYRATSGKYEGRICYLEPESGADPGAPWIVGLREVQEAGGYSHVFHHPAHTLEDAKKAAEDWIGPPPK
jgi:hypothetical protein